MTLRRVLEHPTTSLRDKSVPVLEFDERLQSLTQDLVDTLEVHNGAGLAAPQIGANVRVLVLKPSAFEQDNPEPGSDSDYWVLVNPVLMNMSEKKQRWKEGCLSVPGVGAYLDRHESCTVTYQKPNGGEVSNLELSWPLSGALQHENDHLDGVLYIDHLGRLERDLLIRSVAKRRRLAAQAQRVSEARLELEQVGVTGFLSKRRKSNAGKKKRKKRRK